MTNLIPNSAQPWARRLSDKLRLMFHAACDEAALSIAEQRLNQLCKHVVSPGMRPVGLERRKPESMSGACERLANLQLWKSENGDEAITQEDEAPASSSTRGRRPV
jgi:hypothetical protein